MREHHDTSRRRRGTSDALRRAERRDRAQTIERDYARELRAERRAVELDRFYDRRFA